MAAEVCLLLSVATYRTRNIPNAQPLWVAGLATGHAFPCVSQLPGQLPTHSGLVSSKFQQDRGITAVPRLASADIDSIDERFGASLKRQPCCVV